MDIPLSVQRQIENEMIFRRKNEKVADGIEDVDATHMQYDEPELMWDDAIPIQFKCECADENCSQRISIKLSTYKEIHKDRKAFIVKPDHQVEDIEKVISKNKDYNIVQKNVLPAEPEGPLNITSVQNV